MFVQIHMLQSMPPGNLNRDETGQPKKCIFGGVTRGRISSQCLKRNIRHSTQFKEAFGGALADRTTYLPHMVAEELKNNVQFGVPKEELNDVKLAIARKFKKEKGAAESGDTAKAGDKQESPSGEVSTGDGVGQTGQLVFFPPPFAHHIAKLIAEFKKQHHRAYESFVGHKVKPAITDQEEKDVKQFIENIASASKQLTVDIGLFGRMTTSDLVVNVEASCQVAHAISTHETIIESDYFTAMDDRKEMYANSQMDKAGAAFLGSGDTETFYNAAVYYKYLNLDLDAMRKHLPSLNEKNAAEVAGALLSAAALATPTGKQNSFASHSMPELILVEVSKAKRPLSYANAFLQPVEGGAGRNLMAESAKALQGYLDSVAAAFAPADVQRFVLAVGHARDFRLESKPTLAVSLEKLVEATQNAVTKKVQAAA